MKLRKAKLQDTGYKFPVQVAGYKIHVTSHQIQVAC